MSHLSDLINYILIFRLAIVLAGVVCIVLGYLLFARGVFPQAAGGNAQGQDVHASVFAGRFSLKNAAPGTCFAVLGAFLIITMLLKDSPEVLLKQADLDLQLRGEPALQPAEEANRPHDANGVITDLISAAPMFNDYAWTLHEARREAERAELLARLAVLSAPDNKNFRDTLTRIQQSRQQ